MRDTDRDWAKVAETNPYWAVLSDDRFLGREIDSTERERFFATGEAAVAELFSRIERHFVPDFVPARTLDYGCGVGRMLMPLAHRSGEAVGVDVSPRMVELSRRHLRDASIHNAQVVFPDDPIMQGEAVFDLINSFIVLQHIPPERGYRIFANLLRLLRPGGVAALHVSYARAEAIAIHDIVAKYACGDGQTVVRESSNPLPDYGEGTILVFDYDFNHLMVLAAEAASGPVIAYPTGDHKGHLGAYLYIQKRG
jgi:SAM-dependent methyltransferase